MGNQSSEFSKIMKTCAFKPLISFYFFTLGKTKCNLKKKKGSEPLLFYSALQGLENVQTRLSLLHGCIMLLLFLILFFASFGFLCCLSDLSALYLSAGL